MKIYNIKQPAIEGILSDDFLYFEGIKRPTNILFIKEGVDFSDYEYNILERYFNDIYNLFLRKVSYFVSVSNPTDEDAMRLQALLQELIKIKGMIMGPEDTK